MSYKTLECEQCGDNFKGFHSAKYCSDKCKRLSKTKTKQCEQCEEYFSYENYRHHRTRRYCSRQCAGRATKDQVTLRCKQCGKNFEVRRGRVDAKFCSKKCEVKDQRRVLECEQCGRTFEVQAHKAEKGRKYCSIACKWEAQCVAPKNINDYRRRAVARGEDIREQIPKMMSEQNGKCTYCSTDIRDEFHLEHKTPLARGGEHTQENTHLTCPDCNKQKNIKTHEEYLRFRQKQAEPDAFVQAELSFT